MTLEELQEENLKIIEEIEKLRKENETLLTENEETKKALEKSREINQALINRYAIFKEEEETETKEDNIPIDDKIIKIFKGGK